MMPIRRHQRKPENYGVSAWDGEPQLIFPRCRGPRAGDAFTYRGAACFEPPRCSKKNPPGVNRRALEPPSARKAQAGPSISKGYCTSRRMRSTSPNRPLSMFAMRY
jgi:hypothetical protein